MIEVKKLESILNRRINNMIKLFLTAEKEKDKINQLQYENKIFELEAILQIIKTGKEDWYQ